MRIVMLYNTCWYVFLLRRNLIKHLQACGAHVTVVAPYDKYTERVKALGVSYIPISMSAQGTNPLFEMKTFSEILAALRTARPDAVLSFTVKCNLYAGLCRYFINFRQLANVSGLGEGFDRPGVVSSVVKVLYRIALKNTHRVFFQNPEDMRMCVSNVLASEAHSRLLPGSGVDLSLFSPSYRLADGPRVFLMFGRLLPKKGFKMFLTAARSLKKQFGDRAIFQILGAADRERPESLQLLSDIEAAHAEGVVTYLPPTDNVLPILEAADVVVLPSTYNEGVPRSLLEALACGKPIVTTDWKGCRETVKHKENGYLIKPTESADGLTKALTDLIRMSSEELLRMGRASRLHAERRFDERVVVREYLDALDLTWGATKWGVQGTSGATYIDAMP